MAKDKARLLEAAGLFVLRVSAAAIMAGSHGLPKLMGFADKAQGFSDPLGVGSATSLSLAIFAELFCAILVGVGLFTRVAAAPLVFTMLVAAFVVHADDPFGKKELALLFAIPFASIALIGPGRWSLDHYLARRRGGSRRAG